MRVDSSAKTSYSKARRGLLGQPAIRILNAPQRHGIMNVALSRTHHLLKALLMLFFAVLLFLPAACSQDETAIPIDMSVREEVAIIPEADQVLTYAYLPQFSHTVSFQRHHLLIRYLEAQTGLRIRQVFPDTFDEHMRMVGQGRCEGAKGFRPMTRGEVCRPP